MEETEYRQKYKVPLNGNLRRAFKEKADYRKRRRQMEHHHEPFGEYSQPLKPPQKAYQMGKKTRTEVPPIHIQKESDGYPDDDRFQYDKLPDSRGKSSNIPRLELVSTPTPPKRPIQEKITGSSSGTMTPRGEHGPIMIEVAIPAQSESLEGSDIQPTTTRTLVSKATQTPLSLLSDLLRSKGKEILREGHRELQRSRSFERKLRRSSCDQRHRSKSPFAAYGAGDKEPTIAGKRTFNVKADAAKAFKYETAVNAARRKGHIPDESRKKRRTTASKGKHPRFVDEDPASSHRFPLTEYQFNFGGGRL